MKNALMVDLETMAVSPNAAIVSIGACMFDPYGPLDQVMDETFLVRVSLESNQEAGRELNASTVMWWLRQAPEAQQNLLEDITNLPAAIGRFTKWFQHETTERPDSVWANDPDFDAVILRSAYETVGHIYPLGFWMNRSVRTVGAMAYPDYRIRKAAMGAVRKAAGTHHRADVDAVAQARFIIHCYKELGLS